MPTDRQRIQKRTHASVALQISSAEQPFITELAFSENVSLHGVRVVTERAWKPGERVIVKSCDGSIRSLVRVIYLLLSFGGSTICRWFGATFTGWDVRARFATTIAKDRSVA